MSSRERETRHAKCKFWHSSSSDLCFKFDNILTNMVENAKRSIDDHFMEHIMRNMGNGKKVIITTATTMKPQRMQNRKRKRSKDAKSS